MPNYKTWEDLVDAQSDKPKPGPMGAFGLDQAAKVKNLDRLIELARHNRANNPASYYTNPFISSGMVGEGVNRVKREAHTAAGNLANPGGVSDTSRRLLGGAALGTLGGVLPLAGAALHSVATGAPFEQNMSNVAPYAAGLGALGAGAGYLGFGNSVEGRNKLREGLDASGAEADNSESQHDQNTVKMRELAKRTARYRDMPFDSIKEL